VLELGGERDRSGRALPRRGGEAIECGPALRDDVVRGAVTGEELVLVVADERHLRAAMRRESLAWPAIDGCLARLNSNRRQPAGNRVTAAAKASSSQTNDVLVSMDGSGRLGATLPKPKMLARKGYRFATEKMAPL
jgi:hypothetical protein